MEGSEAVDAALNAGAAIALVTESTGVNCRWADNTLTTSGVVESLDCTAIAIERGSVGADAVDVTSASDCVRAAERAVAAARQAPPAQDQSDLIGPGDTAIGQAEAVEPQGVRTIQPLVEPLRRVLERASADGLRCFGFAEVEAARELLGITTGLREAGRRLAGSVTMTVKTSDLRRSAWVGAVAGSFHEIDLDHLYERAARRLEWSAKTRSVPPGRYEVILEPSATADLILRLAWEMHARGADEGKTAFAGPRGSLVGEQLYAESVTLRGDPGAPGLETPAFVRAAASNELTSVFDNGLAVGPTVWAEGGVQRPLICSRAWARKNEHPVRPPTDNLLMDGSDTTLEAMIRASDRALLITSLWYIREVDPTTLLLTGLTRDGVFLIERGEVVGAVNNFRFNESPIGVLRRTLEVGVAEATLSREVGTDGLVRAPAIRVDGFNLSTVSDAV